MVGAVEMSKLKGILVVIVGFALLVLCGNALAAVAGFEDWLGVLTATCVLGTVASVVWVVKRRR